MNTEGEKQEEIDGGEDDLDEVVSDDPEESIVMTEMPVSDGVSDTVELNVDELIEKVEAQSEDEVHRKKEIRQRLEELAEEGSHEDTYAVDLEDAD
jgi:hypothetical protein